jgi:pyochelin biosynthetic protein PchC
MIAPDAWLRRFDPRPDARVRLVCLPHGGGSAVFYRQWARRLPSWIELVAIQYPGRMDRMPEQRIDSMSPMATAIAEAVAAAVPEPLAMFGHSMGAAIAFEVALRLEGDYCVALRRLFVSGRRAPTCYRQTERHLAPDDRLIAYLGRLGGADPEVLARPHVRPLVLPILRSDFKLSETWTPPIDARLSCPVTALVGDCDPEASVGTVAPWERVTEAGFRLSVHPGGHFYLSPQEPRVLAELVDGLAGAGTEGASGQQEGRSGRRPGLRPSPAAASGEA